MHNLQRFRDESRLLKLFSNRQVMIMFILLSTNNRIKYHFLEKLYSLKNIHKQNERELKLTSQLLAHYLRSLRINDCNLSDDNIAHLYSTYQIEMRSSIDICFKQLCLFLHEVFKNSKQLKQQTNDVDENQQYLVTWKCSIRTPLDHDLDMDTCCILLNLFNNRLPSSYQILWCSSASEDDIHLFFSCVRTFSHLTFVIMDIDKMHHRLRQLLLNEQDSLTRREQPYGSVYYCSKELTTGRKGLKSFHLTPRHRNSHETYQQLITLFQQNTCTQHQIQIIYGVAGIGKSQNLISYLNDVFDLYRKNSSN